MLCDVQVYRCVWFNDSSLWHLASGDHLPLVSSQLVGSVGQSKGTEPTEELLHRESPCAPKHHADECSESSVEYNNGFHGTSSSPSLFFTNPPGSDQRGAEGPADVHTQTNLATEPSPSSRVNEAQCYDNQSTCIPKEQLQGNAVQYGAGGDVCKPSFGDEVSFTPVDDHHMVSSSFERIGSHEEAFYGDCGPFSGTLAIGMHLDVQPQDLQDVKSECQLAEQAFQPLQSSSSPHQIESVQREEQYTPEQCVPIQPASTHHTRASISSRLSPRLLEPGLLQQQNYYSSFNPSSDAFMSLHVAASDVRADHLEFSGSTRESGTMQICGGYHGNQPQKHPHAYDGEHHGNQPQQRPLAYDGGDMGYRGGDLHTSRREPSESVGAYHQRTPDPSADDQPYDPALPLMDLTSFQGNSQPPYYSGRIHPGGNGQPGSHSTHTNRDHRALKNRSHISAPYASSASNMQTFAHVEFESGRGARKQQHAVIGSKHVSGDHMRPLEDKSLVYASFSGRKRKRQKQQCAPHLSKKQRKRMQRREGRMEGFVPLGSSNGGRGGQEHTAKPSSSYGRKASVVGSKEKNNYYSSSMKNDYSDEDLEVLELRKEVIMSIVSNNAEKAQAMKRALAIHTPAGGEGGEVQKKMNVHSPLDDKPPAGACQPDIGEEGQAVCAKVETVQSSPTSGTMLPSVVQLQQTDPVIEVPSVPSPAAVSSIDRPFRGTPLHGRGEESPVMSPLVTALKRSDWTNKSRSASPLQKPKPNTTIKVHYVCDK